MTIQAGRQYGSGEYTHSLTLSALRQGGRRWQPIGVSKMAKKKLMSSGYLRRFWAYLQSWKFNASISTTAEDVYLADSAQAPHTSYLSRVPRAAPV